MIFLQSRRGRRYRSPGSTQALGATPVFIGQNRFDLLVELATASDVCDLDPDMNALAAIPARGIIVTAVSDLPDVDFVSRFFAPALGVPEKPVTGSAHCCLGPYWGEKHHKTELPGSSAPRGAEGPRHGNGDRVILGGHAVEIFSGNSTCESRHPGLPRVILSWLAVTYLTGDKRFTCILSEKHS